MSRVKAISQLLLKAARSQLPSAAQASKLSFLQSASTVNVPTNSLLLSQTVRNFHSSFHVLGQPDHAKESDVSNDIVRFDEPPRRYRDLTDKELWHEAWMYEDKFGTEDDPIVVPCSEPSRVIGVTDPDDDTLMIWGVLNAGDPPRQFVEGGEFFVLKSVLHVKRVGDALLEMEEAAEVAGASQLAK